MTTRRSTRRLELDVVGQWSELKIDIIRKYAHAYTAILKRYRYRSIYIDGFAGAGSHISKQSGEVIDGSPSVALNVSPPFDELHFVDLDSHRTENLRQLAGEHPNVTVYTGDCNEVLMRDILPKCLSLEGNRALVILDPYGLHLDWQVIEAIGKSSRAELFLHFPISDMHRNVFWQDPDQVSGEDLARMNRFWGDDGWKHVVYKEVSTLFGPEIGKDPNATMEISKAFRNRLQTVAGFKFIPEPVPMKNSRNGTLYHLYFASPNKTGGKIVSEILAKYKREGAY